MKKQFLIFLTLFSVLAYSQNPPKFPDGIRITGNQPTVTSVNFLTATNALSGLQEKIDPVLLPLSTATINAINTAVSVKADVDTAKKIPNYQIDSRDGNLGQVVSVNLAEATSYSPGYFVSWVDGNLSANALYTASDFMPVTVGSKYYYRSASSGMIGYGAWYDDNQVFISGFQAGSSAAIMTAPAGAAFVRVTYRNVSSVNDFYFYKTYKFTSYGDSITAANNWQPTLAKYFSLVSVVRGTGGAPISGATGTSLNLDTNIATIPSDSDIITVLGGTNDWAQNKPLGTVNSTDVTTFYGALNVMYKKLITAFPNSVIIALTTTYGEYPSYGGFSDPVGILNNLGLSTNDYANAVIVAAKNNNIRFVRTDNLWNHENITNFINFDGAYLHPNTQGADLMAGKISLDIAQDILKLRINEVRSSVNNALHKVGNESYTGIKTSTNTTVPFSNGLKFINSGGNSSKSAEFNVTGAGKGIDFIVNNSSAYGSYVTVTLGQGSRYDVAAGQTGIWGQASGSASNNYRNVIQSSGFGFRSDNNSTGYAFYGVNASTGTFDFSQNNSTGVLKALESATASTGDLLRFTKNGTTRTKFDSEGNLFFVNAPSTNPATFDMLVRSSVAGVTLGRTETITGTTFSPNLLTGYTSGAGTVSATDTVLQAIQKLNGNNLLKADINSPTFTGDPKVPTATAGDSDTSAANTLFVQTAIANIDIQDIVNATTKTGTIDSGNSQVSILDGSVNNRTFSVTVSPATGGSNLNLQNTNVSLLNEITGTGSGGFIVNSSIPTIIRSKQGVGTTSISIDEPIGNSDINFQALPAGSYQVSVAKVYTDATTVVKTSATLTTDYPDALPGDKVHAVSIIAGAMIYEKTASGWVQFPVTVTP